MNWKNRLTSYNFWISMFSAVLLVLQALKIEFDFIYINEIFTAILGLLVASPFSIIYATLTEPEYVVTFDFSTIFFSIISLFVGVGIVFVGEYFNKKYAKTTQNDSDNINK